MSNPGLKPSIPCWHLYVDEDGVSHQRECRLTSYELQRIGAADPQWDDELGTHPLTRRAACPGPGGTCASGCACQRTDARILQGTPYPPFLSWTAAIGARLGDVRV